MYKETLVRLVAPAAVLVFLCLPLFAASDESPCKDIVIPDLNYLEMRASEGQQAKKEIRNPFRGRECVPTVCWLTANQLASELPCSKARSPEDAVKVFSIFVVPASASAEKGGDHGHASERGRPILLMTSVPDDNLTNQANEKLVITYKPKGKSGETDQAYLRFEWPKDAPDGKPVTHTYVIKGVVTTGEDERFRLSLYAGAEYLYSQQNFGQGFPELTLLLETDFYDKRQHKGYCEQVPPPEGCSSDKPAQEKPNETKQREAYFTLRGYGDVGLMGTSALAADSSSTLTAKSVSGSKAFLGHFGLGAGFTFDLATKNPDHDLSRILVLFLTRIGVISIANVPAELQARLEPFPFDDFFGVRLENAAGTYRGAYLELGLGQSNEFVYQKTKRLKFDSLMPIVGQNKVQLAVRLQVDRPSPFGSLNNLAYIPDDTTTSALERRGAGDVKISLLITYDIAKVFGLFGAPTEVK